MPIARSAFRGRYTGFRPTALGTLAASMAPGTWAALTGVANQNAVLGVGPTTNSTLPFMNSAPWYSRGQGRGNIHILGMDHNYVNGMRDMVYDESINAFTLREEATVDGTGIGHGFDHSAVNPHNGDLYLRRYNTQLPIATRKKVYGSAPGNWVNGPTINEQAQVAIGTCWWGGAFSGAGAQGCYLMFTVAEVTANWGRMMAYDPLADSWFFNSLSMAPGFVNTSSNLYADVIEYSAVKNVAVYGGSNEQPRKMWKMTSDHSVTAMTDVPSSVSVGVSRGCFVACPVSGNFLLLSGGELWELNPDGSGTWTQQTGGRTPPGDVGNSLDDYVIGSAIDTYGVIAYIKQRDASSHAFYLYKHA